MKTLLTKKQATEWCRNNYTTIEHHWSTRGMGRIRIIHCGKVIASASGCGYNRYGAAIGKAIEALFGDELLRLARLKCKGRNRSRKKPTSHTYYGLFYDAIKDKAWLDGESGSQQMIQILQKIGFDLEFIGECDKGQNGVVFYRLSPTFTHTRKYWRE